MNNNPNNYPAILNNIATSDKDESDNLACLLSTIPSIIGDNWTSIKNIPVTIQAESIKYSPESKTLDLENVKIGINIILK